MCLPNQLFNLIAIMDTDSYSQTLSVSSYRNYQGRDKIEEDEIELNGYLSKSIGKSVSFFQPMQVINKGELLKIHIYFSIGIIDIVIHNSEGLSVYHRNTKVVAGDNLYINMSDFVPGNYKIRFINLKNDIIYGDFQVC